MIKRTFFIKIFQDGRQYPILNVTTKQFEMLYELGMYRLSKSIGVAEAIKNLSMVESGEKDVFELSAGDWCVVNVRKDTSIISNNLDEFEPIEIQTSQIVILMKDWLAFLLAYERGDIPGVIHPDKLEGLNS